MADLTADEITYIRHNIGDIDSGNYVLSDVYLEYLFDNQAESSVDGTIVYALRSLIGEAARKVSETNARTGDSKSHQQWFEHLQSLLKDWESRTGLLPVATTGSINLGIDEEDSLYNIT